MTYRLGLKYLWIDSLCIVQDDIDDWRNEGSKMADIYSQGYITLAATGGSDSSAGFYFEASRTEHDRSYTLNDDNGKPYFIFVRLYPSRCTSIPLIQRAWFCQERLLSPRIVHFGKDMLHWECSQSKYNECGTDIIIDTAMPDFPIRDVHGFLKNIFGDGYKWRDTVTYYSKCELTFGKDKLPALQGVAKLVQQDRKCAYYAGLWLDTILFDLLWEVNVQSTTRQVEYHAPSWSWASQRRGVQWPVLPILYKPLVSIKSISTTPAGQNPLGEVTAGTLTLEGKCFFAEIESIDAHFSRLVDRLPNTTRVANEMASVLTSNQLWYPDYASKVLGGQTVTAILLGTMTPSVYCLILKPVNATEGVFERVGYTSIAISEIGTILQDAQDQVVTII